MSNEPTRPEVLAQFTRDQLIGRLTTHQMARHDLGAALQVINDWFGTVTRRFERTGERANGRQFAAQNAARREYERKLRCVNLEIAAIECELSRRKRTDSDNRTVRFAQEFVSIARRRLAPEVFAGILDDARLAVAGDPTA